MGEFLTAKKLRYTAKHRQIYPLETCQISFNQLLLQGREGITMFLHTKKKPYKV